MSALHHLQHSNEKALLLLFFVFIPSTVEKPFSHRHVLEKDASDLKALLDVPELASQLVSKYKKSNVHFDFGI